MLELVGAAVKYPYGARLFGAVDAVFSDGEITAVVGGEGSKIQIQVIYSSFR